MKKRPDCDWTSPGCQRATWNTRPRSERHRIGSYWRIERALMHSTMGRRFIGQGEEGEADRPRADRSASHRRPSEGSGRIRSKRGGRTDSAALPRSARRRIEQNRDQRFPVDQGTINPVSRSPVRGRGLADAVGRKRHRQELGPSGGCAGAHWARRMPIRSGSMPESFLRHNARSAEGSVESPPDQL